MKLGYTEFSYGYAFTENLIRSMPVTPLGAPIFPNLVQEAQAGFDVRINLPGLPLFFQYKLPELMLRNSAFEISKHNLAGIAVPFFRMKLMRRDLLTAAPAAYGTGEEVSARCTLCHACAGQRRGLQSGLQHHQRAPTIGIFLSNDIGRLPDDAGHSVAYRNGSKFAYLCSEPKRINVKTYEHLSEDVRSLFHENRFRSLRNASAELVTLFVR